MTEKDQSPTGLPTPCVVIGGDQPCEHVYEKREVTNLVSCVHHHLICCIKCGAFGLPEKYDGTV